MVERERNVALISPSDPLLISVQLSHRYCILKPEQLPAAFESLQGIRYHLHCFCCWCFSQLNPVTSHPHSGIIWVFQIVIAYALFPIRKPNSKALRSSQARLPNTNNLNLTGNKLLDSNNSSSFYCCTILTAGCLREYTKLGGLIFGSPRLNSLNHRETNKKAKQVYSRGERP